MKRLVLHLGLPRTGTTSIQTFLAANRDALLAKRVLYPLPSGATPQHKNFARTALNRDAAAAVNHVELAMELLDTETNLTDRSGPLPAWSALLDRMAAEDLEAAVVSYENFALAPRKYDLSPLDLPLKGYQRVGIVYLRHPQDWLVSLYEQHIRGKRRGTAAFAEFGQFGGLTADRRLRVTKRAFKLDTLVPLDFAAAARNNGLIPSFLDAAGLSDVVTPGGDVHRNAAFSPWQTLFLRECNRRGVSDAAFVWIRQTITNANRLGVAVVELKPGLDMLTPTERADLTRVAAADVAELAEKRGLALRGPKPVAEGGYRPFSDADFAEVVAALRSRTDLRPRIPPEAAAEFARVTSAPPPPSR